MMYSSFWRSSSLSWCASEIYSGVVDAHTLAKVFFFFFVPRCGCIRTFASDIFTTGCWDFLSLHANFDASISPSSLSRSSHFVERIFDVRNRYRIFGNVFLVNLVPTIAKHVKSIVCYINTNNVCRKKNICLSLHSFSSSIKTQNIVSLVQ